MSQAFIFHETLHCLKVLYFAPRAAPARPAPVARPRAPEAHFHHRLRYLRHLRHLTCVSSSLRKNSREYFPSLSGARWAPAEGAEETAQAAPCTWHGAAPTIIYVT